MPKLRIETQGTRRRSRIPRHSPRRLASSFPIRCRWRWPSILRHSRALKRLDAERGEILIAAGNVTFITGGSATAVKDLLVEKPMPLVSLPITEAAKETEPCGIWRHIPE